MTDIRLDFVISHRSEVILQTANINVKGAVYYDCDAHTTPSDFMPQMLNHLKSFGVTVLAKEEVVDIEVTDKTITKVITDKRAIEADEVVLAAGSWSPLLSKKLGLKLRQNFVLNQQPSK